MTETERTMRQAAALEKVTAELAAATQARVEGRARRRALQARLNPAVFALQAVSAAFLIVAVLTGSAWDLLISTGVLGIGVVLFFAFYA